VTATSVQAAITRSGVPAGPQVPAKVKLGSSASGPSNPNQPFRTRSDYRLLLHTRPLEPDQIDAVLDIAFEGLRDMRRPYTS
jgi:hypothetical protein